MEKIKLSHVVLYSKDWYKKTDTVEDLKKCLTADGYGGEFFNEDDIIILLLNQMEFIDDSGVALSDFHTAIKEENCWSYGYCTDKNMKLLSTAYDKPYDFNTAVILWCLSAMRNTLTKNYVIVKPNFDVLPMGSNVNVQMVETVFNKIN